MPESVYIIGLVWLFIGAASLNVGYDKRSMKTVNGVEMKWLRGMYGTLGDRMRNYMKERIGC